MSLIWYVAVDEIDRRADARPLDEAVVQALAGSIKTVGLLNAIVVRRNGDRFELMGGAHRLAALKLNGETEIAANVVESDDLHAELSMIDENLCRSELTPADRAQQTARRKAIYLVIHPETAEHVAGGKGNATADNLSAVPSFAASTASVTGKDERSVRRDAERGEKVIDEVLDMIRGTHLDTGAYLDKLKALPGNEQFTAAKRDLAAGKKSPAPRATHTPAREADPPPGSRATTRENVIAGRQTHEFGRLLEIVDEALAFNASDVVAGCPPRQRALLCQRASSLIDLLTEILEGASS